MSAMTTATTSPLENAALLDPPRGYRVLAWLGLVANVLAIPAGIVSILRDPTWRVTNIAVGAGAALPTAVLGLVACIALLRWRHWGQILAIVALSLSLAVLLPYGVVRVVLLEQDRLALAVAFPIALSVNVAALVYWCRPAIRGYLR